MSDSCNSFADPQRNPLGPWARPGAKPPLNREDLIQALRLAHDPFQVAVSESDATFNFARIYVDPPIIAGPAGEQGRPMSLIQRLMRPRHSFVFAAHGMGKTATRLALEYTLREAYTYVGRPVLHVSYQLVVRSDATDDVPLLLGEQLAQIARNLTTDLVIQCLERLSERVGGLEALTSGERAALERQLRAAPESLRVVLRGIARGSVRPDKLWRVLRPTVRPEIRSEQWVGLVRDLVSELIEEPISEQGWRQVIADAGELGFGQVFLALDALDEQAINMDVVGRRIEPLMEMLPAWEAEGLFLKCFLPVELYTQFEHKFATGFASLTAEPELATIDRSTHAHLAAILEQRMRAVLVPESLISSLDQLRGPGFEQSIEDRLAAWADGSPRAVLDLASRLLDYHSTHGFATHGRIWMTPEEWRDFRAELAELGLAPPP